MKFSELVLGMKVRIPAGIVGEVIAFGEFGVEVDLGSHSSIYTATQLIMAPVSKPVRGYFR